MISRKAASDTEAVQSTNKSIIILAKNLNTIYIGLINSLWSRPKQYCVKLQHNWLGLRLQNMDIPAIHLIRGDGVAHDASVMGVMLPSSFDGMDSDDMTIEQIVHGPPEYSQWENRN